MDPMNNTVPNVNPDPAMGGGAMPGEPVQTAPSMGGMPATGAPMQPMGGAPVQPASDAGQAMATPAQVGGVPGQPMGAPMQPMGMGAPVQPGGGIQANIQTMSPDQMFQTGGVVAPMGALGAAPGDLGPAGSPLLGATDPITMPAPPKAPDPVEEELKAPFKAAAPVPGSIGSAISMPGDPGQVPNVAFNDPASMAPNDSAMPNKTSLMAKLGIGGGKKMDKKTLIILGSVAGLVIIGIIVVVVTAL